MEISSLFAYIYQLPESTDTGQQCLMEYQVLSCPGAAKVKQNTLH